MAEPFDHSGYDKWLYEHIEKVYGEEIFVYE